MEDDRTSSAVIRKFEKILGEATKQIPDGLRQQYPGVPWKEMAGMRDRLIHLYFGVDYQIVWKTIGERLPILKAGYRSGSPGPGIAAVLTCGLLGASHLLLLPHAFGPIEELSPGLTGPPRVGRAGTSRLGKPRP